jgi:hypothetical protein
MSAVRIQKADRQLAPRQPKTLERVMFDERMVMIRHLVDEADPEEAQHYFRTMLEQCKFLSRRFGLNLKG